MFKVGDYVICINNSDVDKFLIKDCIYMVKYTNSSEDLIGFYFDDNACWYTDRFVLDVKRTRLRKLQKIYSK